MGSLAQETFHPDAIVGVLKIIFHTPTTASGCCKSAFARDLVNATTLTCLGGVPSWMKHSQFLFLFHIILVEALGFEIIQSGGPGHAGVLSLGMTLPHIVSMKAWEVEVIQSVGPGHAGVLALA